jgi:tetratricopeptide (TPR) repeat protein
VDTALAAARNAVALARQTGDPLTITTVLAEVTDCSFILRDTDGAASFAEEAMARARDHGFAYWERRAKVILGWISAWRDGAHVGVSEIREAIASARSVGEDIVVAGMLIKLSEAELATGDPNAAAEAANEALRLFGLNNSRPLLCSGDAMVALGDRTQAEADFHRALAWYRDRNEKWGELNAALRLARLWQTDGRAGDARDVLAPVYGWFREGFDNPVLRDAKALLEELTGTIDSTAISDRPADPRAS